MMKLIKTKLVKAWLDNLYVSGLITRDEYDNMVKLTKYQENVGRKYRHLIPKQ